VPMISPLVETLRKNLRDKAFRFGIFPVESLLLAVCFVLVRSWKLAVPASQGALHYSCGDSLRVVPRLGRRETVRTTRIRTLREKFIP
jgi:hypothetical protein